MAAEDTLEGQSSSVVPGRVSSVRESLAFSLDETPMLGGNLGLWGLVILAGLCLEEDKIRAYSEANICIRGFGWEVVVVSEALLGVYFL